MHAAELMDKADGVAERPKQIGADRAEQMAKAVHKAADQLQDEMPKAAEFVHMAASHLEKGAETLRNRGMGERVGQFNELWQKQPFALFGAALAAGFVASRFFKSSAVQSK